MTSTRTAVNYVICLFQLMRNRSEMWSA